MRTLKVFLSQKLEQFDQVASEVASLGHALVPIDTDDADIYVFNSLDDFRTAAITTPHIQARSAVCIDKKILIYKELGRGWLLEQSEQSIDQDVIVDAIIAVSKCDSFLDFPEIDFEDSDQAYSAALSPEDFKKIILDWNNTASKYPSDKTLTQIFEEHVAGAPEQIALFTDSISLTYKELNERANQVAHYLISTCEVQHEELIAVCLDRDEWLIIAVLGILKAGAAYVPLDAAHPDTRLSYMINDSAARLLLTNEEYATRFQQVSDVDVIGIDSSAFRSALQALPAHSPTSEATHESLAHVIYTSGTTGTPKGVMIDHENVISLVSPSNYFVTTPSMTVVHVADFSFDAATYEIFSALLNGARLYLPEGKQLAADLVRFTSALRRHQVDVLLLTKSVFDQLFLFDPTIFSGMSALLVGGEALNHALVSRLLHSSQAPKRFINIYGPTESTTFACAYQGDASAIDTYATVPIGKPISNRSAYILDEKNLPVTVGATGELFLGGSGVARGYLNQPALTQDRFINNPFDVHPGARRTSRLYRTGDLARYLPSGDIEFVGRSDFQVKLRGFRIELTEIEAAMTSHLGVRQAVVTVQENCPGDSASKDKSLVGFYVAEKEYSQEEWVNFLKERLPAYMVPSVMIMLPRLPLTSNGKLDRLALADIAKQHSERKTEFFSWENRYQDFIANLWHKVLPNRPDLLSLDSDFLALGGHSLLVTRLIIAIREEFGVMLPSSAIYTFSRLGDLAAHVEFCAEQQVDAPQLVAPSEIEYQPFSLIERSNDFSEQSRVIDAYPASSIQKGMLLESEINPSNAYLNLMTFRFMVPLDLVRLKSVWQRLVARHEALRTSFVHDHDYGILARVHESSNLNDKIVLVDGNGLTEQEIEIELSTKFPWEIPGLFKLLLLQEQHRSFRLVLTFHHVILDGWSAASLIDEFCSLYTRGESNATVARGALPRYGEYVRDEMVATNRADLRDFWQSYLKEFSPQNHVNWIFEPRLSTHSRLQYTLEADLSRSLLSLAESNRVSIDTLFLVAYVKLLEVFYSSDDFSIGLVFHNRLNKEGGDQLLGCFLNTVPLRCNGLDGATYLELIQRLARERVMLEQHKALPYIEIKGLSGATTVELFQAAFAYTNFPIFNSVQDSVERVVLEDVKEQASIPLNLDVSRQNDAFEVFFTADGRFVDENFLSYLNRFFVHYLTEMVRAPVRVPTRFPEGELERVLVSINSLKDAPINTNVICEFERHCQSSPERVAAVFDGQSLSYDELNRKANRFARTLLSRGVVAQTCVAVVIDRGIDFLVSMIAAWKINAYYTPIHPETPVTKLVEILSQIDPRAVVVNNDTFEALSKSDGQFLARAVFHSTEDAENSAENLNIQIFDQDIAYTIFTSGSTGVPKGAIVQHQGMINHIFAKVNDFSITQDDVIAQTASQTFDVHVWQFMTALMVGGSTVILGGERAWVPDLLIAELNKDRISIFESVPAHLAVILDYVEHATDKPCFTYLRLLMMNGEGLPATYCARWFESYPHISMANVYGPAECSDDVTHFGFDTVSASWEGYVPIGQPIQNTQLYVLNEQMLPVPDGVVGDVFVGGVGVGLGYLGSPQKTEESFLKNPFDSRSKLYKTGDIARRLPDGNLEYFGRKDFQIKIRGQRVELGEIETVILKCEDIKQVAVIPSLMKGQQSLTAFYTSYSAQSTSDEVLRKFLSDRVEGYLVPQTFLHLETLPLNQNGKLDRGVLLQQAQALLASVPAQKDSFSELEQSVHTLWTEVLGVSVNDLHADFFLSGGNSLSVITLLNKINRRFDVKLPIRWCFEHTSIADQCSSISLSSDLAYYAPIIDFSPPIADVPTVFLIHPGAGSAVIYSDLASELKGEMNVCGVESYNIYNSSHHLLTIQDMAAHYVSLVTEKHNSNVFYLGGWSLGGVIAYEMARQLTARGAIVKTVFLLDSLLPEGVQLEKLQRFHTFIPTILEANGFLERFPEYYKHDILTALDIEMTALREYVPGRSDFPVKLIKSLVAEQIPEMNSANIDAADLGEINRLFNDFNSIEDNGWGRYCQSLTVYEVDGGHASLVSENKERVAIIIKESTLAI